MTDGFRLRPDARRAGEPVALPAPDPVVLTAGGSLRFMCGWPLSYGFAGPSEDVLLDGIPHESYALDSQGWGLPVDGLGPVEIGVV